jgi:hypothetical protein
MGIGHRIMKSWQLGWSGLRVIWNDKTLLGFPAVTVAAVIAILSLIYLVIPNFGMLLIAVVSDATAPSNGSLFYSLLILWYFMLAFVAVFMHVALVGAIQISMKQRDSVFRDGILTGLRFVPSIIVWTLINYTFGFFVTLLDQSRHTTRYVRKVLGAAWSVITFLAVPVMVVENTSIFMGLAQSNKLMEKKWGQNLHPGFSLGYFFMLLNVPTIIYATFVYFQPAERHLLLELLGAMYFLLTMVMIQASRSVLMVTLYHYATTGEVAPGFNESFLKSAFVPWDPVAAVPVEPAEPAESAPAPAATTTAHTTPASAESAQATADSTPAPAESAPAAPAEAPPAPAETPAPSDKID